MTDRLKPKRIQRKRTKGWKMPVERLVRLAIAMYNYRVHMLGWRQKPREIANGKS